MRKESMKESFVRVYASESDSVFRFCFLRTSDREVAIDLTQEAFVRLWDTLSKGDADISNHRAFLFTIARHLVIDWYRKKKPVSLDALEEDGEDSPGESVARFESTAEIDSDARRLIDTMQQLEEPYRQAVHLRYVDELKPREIAEMLGESVNVISVRINRGLHKLRILLHHEE